MPAFAKPEEVYRYLGGIFETAFADPELAEKLAATGLVLKMVCTNPDSALVIDTPNGKVVIDAFDHPSDATMSPDTAVTLGKLGGLGVLNVEGLWTRYEDPTKVLKELSRIGEDAQATRRQQRRGPQHRGVQPGERSGRRLPIRRPGHWCDPVLGAAALHRARYMDRRLWRVDRRLS